MTNCKMEKEIRNVERKEKGGNYDNKIKNE